MLEPLVWWVLVELIGLAAWPVAFRFFGNLPDRGYAFTKPLGLLLLAYPFWLLTTFGFLSNTQGAIALLAVILAVSSWGLLGRARAVPDMKATEREPSLAGIPNGHAAPATGNPESLDAALRENGVENPLAWLREHLTLVLIADGVFTLAFVAWVAVRAFMPEITATEKPMEFAFLNGILQSTHFPPQDPWLAGYAISYYYFGYIIVAMLTLLSGIPSSITFNLAIALLFALASTGAFGLAYDLISGLPSPLPILRRFIFALFAPILLLVIGNLEGFFEALHARGLGTPEFWNWLDVKGLAEAPVTGTFAPEDNWWWWRASRVIHDVARGQTQEVIDEFPQFSFLLGDMHPHVLALPFVLLALALALNLLKSGPDALASGDFRDALRRPAFLARLVLTSVVIGALPFLNYWDILPYGFILVAAFAVGRYKLLNRWDGTATRDWLTFAVSLGVVSLFLYLPFYVAFQSQAGGILPVLFVKTKLHQYLIMFGLFISIFIVFFLALLTAHRGFSFRDWLSRASPFLIALLAFPLLVAGLTLLLLVVSPGLQQQARDAFPEAPGNLLPNVLNAYFGPLFSDPWLVIMLIVLLAVTLVLLRVRVLDVPVLDASITFVLLMVFTGLLLTFGPEFVYLRDVFGTRMNTIFKFYFQSWTLFAVSAAFAIYYVSNRLGGMARGAWFGALFVLLVASLVYPASAIPNRADGFARAPTLDGIQWIRNANPADYAGIQWLQENAPRSARILESTGRQYSYDDRMSMATGLPTVLGWIGHEDQWRGGSALYKNAEAGIDRAADVARIYQTLDAKEALTLVDKYAINFVVVGQPERSQYGLTKAQVDKFGKVMALAFENGDLRIYARSQ